MKFNDAFSALTGGDRKLAMPAAEKTKFKNAVCVSIDPMHSRFDFYSMENEDRSTVSLEHKDFSSRLYSAEFMTELTEAARDYAMAHPMVKDASVVLVVPDAVVAMDTIAIPTMNRRRNSNALDAVTTTLYKNKDKLFVNSVVATQNKSMVTYSTTAIDQKLVKALSTAMEDGEMAAHGITFAANTTTNAVGQLCPKMKNSSYLLMDIKHHATRVAFVAKGRVTGYYALPFGYSILRKNKVAAEEMLFDHSVAELAVLNAREKAKAKQLTIMHEEENADGEGADGEEKPAEEQLDSLFGQDENATADPTTQTSAATIKTLPRKVPRKLPKFMQRPMPKTDEEFGYENFRIFMKWALTLLEANGKLTTQGEPEAVFVNMPGDLHYLFDIVNEEQDSNGIAFQPLDIRGDRDEIADNLELYGGLYALQMNRNHVFSTNKG